MGESHEFSGPGMAVYKCRRCGKLEKHLHAPVLVTAITDAITDNMNVKGMRATLISMHQCDDGHIGITDLIGGEYD